MRTDTAGLGRTLFSMTWPMLFGVLSLMSFQLADSAFIGRLGVEPLAALGFTLPVWQVVIGLQVGIGIATTAVISRALGAGETARARHLGGVVVAAGALLVLLLCVFGWMARGWIVGSLGAGPELLPTIDRFWLAWLPSAWVGAMLYFGYSICRAHGDTRLPGLLMVLTSLLNLGLDPLFIFVFGWGLPGAALATLVAFGLGTLVVFRQVLRRGWMKLQPQRWSVWLALRQLAAIAGPAMFSQLLPPLAALFATALVAGFGAAAVGAWALASRLEFFSIVVVLALTMSLPPLVGRYLGAGDVERVRSLVRIAVGFVLVWQLAVALLWLLLSGATAALLAENVQVGAIVRDYLARVPFSYGPLGVCMIMVSVCNALGLPMRALSIAALRLFACYLPALWLGARFGGLPGLFSGALIGNVATGILAWMLYRRGLERLNAREVAAAA